MSGCCAVGEHGEERLGAAKHGGDVGVLRAVEGERRRAEDRARGEQGAFKTRDQSVRLGKQRRDSVLTGAEREEIG